MTTSVDTSTNSLAPTIAQANETLSTGYSDIQDLINDPDFGTDPTDMLNFQFKMNTWATQLSAYSNAIKAILDATKQITQNLK